VERSAMLKQSVRTPRKLLPLLLVLGTWALFAPPACAQSEFSRREYATPGLIVETGARRGACDVLLFTPDGKHLLACGDDKVVRVWKYTPGKGLEPADVPALRWPMWHESRGNIYAMALSPDNKRIAVGGLGMTTGAVAVLDCVKGTVVHAFGGTETTRHGTIWAMAYAPKREQIAYGGQDGSVWVWDLTPGKQTEPRQLGKHDTMKKGIGYNYVRHVAYLGGDRLVSVSQNGQVMQWDNLAPGASPKAKELFRFTTPAVHRVALSPDQGWLAGASDAAGYRMVEMRSLPDGRQKKELNLPAQHFPHSLAFSRDSTRLAVGVRVVDDGAGKGDPFYKEVGSKVFLYDLRKPQPQPATGPSCSYNPEALAFHPEGNHLAVAGGNDHEVALWDLRTLKKVSEIKGPGSGLWNVTLSPDGRYLGFKDQRNNNPQTPNDRGKGPWKVFDLQNRSWAPAEALKVAPPSGSAWGWKVRTGFVKPSDKDKEKISKAGIKKEEMANSYIWFVESPEGNLFKLPLDPDRDKLPRCYAFLPGAKPGKPDRLAVGHLWGVSIFELTAKGPRLVRFMAGHEGEVMSLAVARDQKRLVSVARDQTVSGWSLEDWPSQAELGARFFVRQDQLFVDEVDPGGPAWEAGLSKGDQIVMLAVEKERPLIVFNRNPKRGKDVGTAKAALAELQQPVPGKELFLGCRRVGVKQVIEMNTRLRQRPLWRFFPARDGEWVLWRWRDHYYDTSTNGDYLLGWQLSHYDLTKTPHYYRAEQFRKRFHRPDLVAELLRDWRSRPDNRLVAFASIEPPAVTLTPSATVVKDRDLTVTLSAVPGDSESKDKVENQAVTRVVLWVNDYQFAEWKGEDLKLDEKGAFRTTVTVPRDKLRGGDNLLTLQCYNHGAARGEAKPVLVRHERQTAPVTLHGLFVGAGRYRDIRSRLPEMAELHANDDAKTMYELWRKQGGKLYAKVALSKPLLDEQATRENILQQLRGLQGQVKPDDRLLIHLGGHGATTDEVAKLIDVLVKRDKGLAKQHKELLKQLDGLGSFLYCCDDFDVTRLRETTVTFEELYEVLIRLPCHKVLLLDACHSGSTKEGIDSSSGNPIRVLTRDGVGPVILAACRPDESAFEEGTLDLGIAHGLFTIAIRWTLEKHFAEADANKNRLLEPKELFDGVDRVVQRLIRQLRDDGLITSSDGQHPIAFLPRLSETLPLAHDGK
jgi:WD40 repeat protein